MVTDARVRPRRHVGAVAAMALVAMLTLSGCEVIDYYRQGGEGLWNFVGGVAGANEAASELADELRLIDGVDEVSHTIRPGVVGNSDVFLDVSLGTDSGSDSDAWRQVADAILAATAEQGSLAEIDVHVVQRSTSAHLTYNVEIFGARVDPAEIAAVPSIARAWGVKVRAETSTSETRNEMVVWPEDVSSDEATRAFAVAADELREITDGLSRPVLWDMPGYSGTVVPSRGLATLIVDSDLALGPSVRATATGNIFAQDSWPAEFIGAQVWAEYAIVHVFLDPDTSFADAPGWPAFVATARSASRADQPIGLQAAWNELDASTGELGHRIGGVRFPADDCVADLFDQEAEVGAALMRAGIPADAFSLGAACVEPRG